MTAARVPALIVSGFLGAGKTTLVRHVLDDAQRAGLRVAVVTNEFGDLGVDAALLQAPDDTVELRGGCICCRLSDELVDTLTMLRERVRPDRIVIETSGVALPYDVQLHFWRDPLRDWIGEDLVAVVVDADRVRQGIRGNDTFEQQVTSADLLVLNQLDRVSAGEAREIESMLREIEPEAPIVRAVHARVPPELLFPPNPGDSGRMRSGPPPEAPPHAHEDFETEEISVPDGTSETALVESLRARAALRVKGFVRTDEGLRLVQGVGARIELAVPKGDPPDDLIGRIVIIRRPTG